MKLSAQVRSTHSQDGAVVLDILHGEMFRLNFVGSRMLELLEQGFTEAQIAQKIAIEFEAEPQIIAQHLRAFIAHLETQRLIESVPNTQSQP